MAAPARTASVVFLLVLIFLDTLGVA